MEYFGKFNVLGLNICACDYGWIIKKIISNKNKKIIIAPVASHPIALAYFDREYKKILKKIDFLLPDSQYVRWAIKLLYGIKLKDRIYGPDLLLKLCEKIEKDKSNIFLIGNDLNKLMLRLEKLFPNLKIKSFFDLDYQRLTNGIIKNLDKRIIKSKSDFTFIGIGSPSQHNLAIKLNINDPIICVGAAFDFISGIKKQAPAWIGNMGFEWLFRLLTEPKRLWYRYFQSILFILLILYKKITFLITRNK